MPAKEHWDKVYSTKATNAVNWFQEHADLSLRLIRGTGVPADGSIIDVGDNAAAFRSFATALSAPLFSMTRISIALPRPVRFAWQADFFAPCRLHPHPSSP